MIEAVIFDMDGTLLDSEPLWGEAEEEIYPSLGIPYSNAFADQVTGLRTDEAIRFWYDKHPWKGPTIDQVTEQFRTVMAEKLRAAPILPGVRELIDTCRQNGIRMAVASSSARYLMEVGLEQLGLELFDVIHSAEDEVAGKPDPAVYLSTLRKMNVAPHHTIAFEDSINGMKSALAAGIYTIVVPSEADYSNAAFASAHKKFRTLAEVNLDILDPQMNLG